MKNKNLIIISIIISILFVSCNKTASLKKESKFALGTLCSVSLEETVNQKIFDNCFEIIDKVEEDLSAKKDTSYIGKLNKEKKVVFSPEIYDFVKKAYFYSFESKNVFNPSLGKVISLWGIATEHPSVPSYEELRKVEIDNKKVVFNDEKREIVIPDNMEIDLGGIGKGYAANQIRDYLESENIERAIINLGGNILLIGSKQEGKNWTIGLQDPFKTPGESYMLLSLSDTSIVTSGPYERYFEDDGKIYHHIIDPSTLYPCDSDIQSSTIISKDSTLCDYLSTTCFILGSEKALEYLKKYPEVSAVFLLKNNKIVFSDNFRNEYKILNSNYSI